MTRMLGRTKKSARIPLRVSLLWILLLSTCALVVWTLREPLILAYEDVSFALAPSAERAYQYGERHFGESEDSNYDIDRAKYFLSWAAQKDPDALYVYHELARIEFLQGNFTEALRLINIQIARHGTDTPNSFYIRGLIEGYVGMYEESAADYKYFLQFDPHNWAAANDCAWVLLKAGKVQEAADITSKALLDDPNNPWLLNTNATALYEIGKVSLAKERITHAQNAVTTLTDAEWSHAYPGNDPLIAPQGVAAFKEAVQSNYAHILSASATHE